MLHPAYSGPLPCLTLAEQVERDPIAARADAHQRARILRAAAEGRAMRHEYLNPKSGPGRARGWIVSQYDALSVAAARQEAIGNGLVTP